MAGISTVLSARGLVTSANNLGATEQGALVEADNVVIRFADIIEPRRGQQNTGSIQTAQISCFVGPPSGGFRFVQTTTPHGFSNGDIVFFERFLGGFSGPFTVLSSHSLDFTIADASTNAYIAVQKQGIYAPGDYLRQMMFFDSGLVFNTHNGKLANLGNVGAPYTGTWFSADYGAEDSRMKSTVVRQNLHMATNKGMYVLESLTSQPRASGLPVPPDPTVQPVTASAGFLADTNRCGFKIVYGRTDIHGTKNYYLGPPSYPVVVLNTTGGLANARLTIRTDVLPTSTTDPTKFADGLFVQIYRTVQVAPGIPSVGDNYLQVFEQPLGGADFVSTISITDSTPDAFIEVGSTGDALPLYTNSDSEGPTQRNDPPPYSRDVATWQSRTWYAQTTNLHSLSIKLLGVGGGGTEADGVTGLRAGDVVIIDGVSFTGIGSGFPLPGSFLVYTSGTSAENILVTARNLVNAVNIYAIANPSFTINAFLTTGEAVPPTILLERDTYPNNTVFSVTFKTPLLDCTTGAASGGVRTVTTATDHGYIEGDVVTLDRAGFRIAKNFTVLATGLTATQFRITDSTAIAYNTVYRAYGETAWNPALPRTGTAVSSNNDDAPNRLCFSKIQEPESVPRYVNSLDIGTPGKKILRIQPMRDQMLVFKEEGTYVVYADEPYSVALLDNTVQLQAIDTVSAVGSTVFALVDDGVAAFTESSIQPTSVVIQNQLMPYLGSLGRDSTADAYGIAHESDQLFSLWIPAIPGQASCPAKTFVYGLRGNAWTTWSFPTAQDRTCGRVDPFSDSLYMGAIDGSIWRERHSSRRSDYVDDTSTPIQTTVTWATHVFGQPAATKQAREMHMHFKQADFNTGTLTFKVDKNTIPSSGPTPITPGSVYSVDKFIGPWEQPQQFRVLVPQDAQRGAYFTFTWSTNEAKAYWALNGFSTIYENTSERTNTVRT